MEGVEGNPSADDVQLGTKCALDFDLTENPSNSYNKMRQIVRIRNGG